MISNIDSIHNYSPNEKDALFFDANVWLAIYGPSPKHWAQKACSGLFRKALKEKIGIYTNSLIISEFINSWARLEFHQQRDKLGFKSNEYKRFRSDSVFDSISEEISINVEKILDKTISSDSKLGNVDLSRIISEYKSGNYDFNDLIFKDICKANDYILVTNDSDFQCRDVKILTANKKLLNLH